MQELFEDLKKYLATGTRYAKVEFVSKMTSLVSALILLLLLFMLGSVVVLFLSYTFGLFLANYVGGQAAAFGIVALIYVCVAVLVYANRKKLIVNPLAAFLAHLFLTDKQDEDEQE